MRRDDSVLRALSHVDGPVVAADAQGTIRLVSNQAAEVLGHEAKSLEGHPLISIIPERLRQAHLEAFRRYAIEGKSRLEGRTVRVAALAADGSERPVDLTVRVFEAPSGQPIAVGLVATALINTGPASMLDVERRMAEESFRRL